MSRTPLPPRARLLIAAATISAVVAIAWGVAETVVSGSGPVATLAVLGVMLLLSNRFPLLLYGPNYSEAVSFDDGLLAVVLALVPSGSTILLFAGAQLGAQVWRRRAPVKAAFNTAQFTLSAEAAVLVANTVGRTPGHVSPTLAPAILAGVATFIAVNAVLVGALLKVVAGQPFRAAWREGKSTRLLLVAIGTTTGLLSAIAAASSRWALIAVPVAFVLLRQVLAGHFEARRDRDRVVGLLDAANDLHGAMADGTVKPTLESIASRVLRGQAQVCTTRPLASELSAELADQAGWLVVTGRNPGEPFDKADRQLLSALATVAGGALTNAALYTEVHQQRREMATVLSNLAEGVCAFDRDARPTFWNAAAQSLLAMTGEDFSADHPVVEQLLAPVRRCLQSETPLSASMSLVLADATMLPISYTCAPTQDSDGIDGVVLAFRDDTERNSYETQLAHHAFHDQLTGLANRRLFIDRLDQALLRAARGAGVSAVIFADVDRFKVINDSLGHQAGDRLLKEIASRLTGLIRDGDTVARFGGDEFTLLLENVGSLEEAHQLADRIVVAMQEPIEVAPHRSIVTSLSIGVAVARPDATGDDLLHDADLAMYEAKAEGLGRWRQYSGGSVRSAEQLDLEADLRTAITGGEIRVYFQPLVDATSGRPADAEALVRWMHPQRGLVSPADFIPIAEETGLILPLGRLVLQEACRQCRAWETERGVRIGVSVNLSARQFQDTDLVEMVRDTLVEAGLPPERLCLEVTETLAMRDIEWTINTLQRLKAIGVRVAIDDFGTGHSSLNYLKRFPIDVVKIDGSFVRDIDTSVVDNAIVTAVVMLAQTLQITTVAECVESAGQLTKLRNLGCTLIQGYLFARPMPAPEVADWLAAASTAPLRIPTPRPSLSAIASAAS
ncbi:MAG TPA: EAL domain-containing protein [Mycobacteriales bacterium]|nr:EAL domain-containing protein [Mycobacteriales bacterium]